MNIIVVKADGTFYTRPDTTLVRVARDFYLPDDFSSVTARTCTYIKVIKAGKAVPRRFASRYFDEVGKGILLYPDDKVTYIDGSSYFFEPLQGVGLRTPEELSYIGATIERITRHMSIRFADIIAFEHEDPVELHIGDTVNRYQSGNIESADSFAFNIC